MRGIKQIGKTILTTNRLFPHNAKERNRAFDDAEKRGLNNIPIFIINFNRLECLKAMLKRLEELGSKNINIIDNASTYEPLLKYYDTIPYKVYRMEKNWGHRVFWECQEFERYRSEFYILSDGDIIPVDECPENYIETFFSLLKKYPRLNRAGFSLKIDDLPSDGVFDIDEIIGWERQFYDIFLKKDNAYLANIDTTFALYAPEHIVTKTRSYSSLRTGAPIQARHLPWYKKEGEVTDEDLYYSQHKSNGWWNIEAGTITPDTEDEKKLAMAVIRKEQ